ncbi:MAG: universal stress protein, partial [Bacteroidota bacterium]
PDCLSRRSSRVPLLPGLGILANLYLLSQIFHHTGPLLLAITCLILGVLGYFAWKGSQAEELGIEGVPSRVAVGRYAIQEGKFRILVPLSNPHNVEPLIRMAAGIGKDKDTEIIALRVVTVPVQAIPSEEEAYVKREQAILDMAHQIGHSYGASVTSLLRIGHHAGRAILETSRERGADLILMGWKGYTSTRQRILGDIMDSVVRNAKSDIMLVKLAGEKAPRNFLLPTAGGEHALKAGKYMADLVKSNGGNLTLSAVADPGLDTAQREEMEARLRHQQQQLAKDSGIEIGSKIIEDAQVTSGIVSAAESYDAVVVGAAGYGYFQQILFGSIPESIAREVDKTVILVKHYHPVKSLIERIMGD